MTGEEATRLGYRRVSNSHCIVSRVDRVDWLSRLAKSLNRPYEEMLSRSGKNPVEWAADHYRRCFSKDTLVLSPTEYKKVPSSSGDQTGYVPKLELLPGRDGYIHG